MKGNIGMTNSKQKGARGERELSRKLREFGYAARRSVQYNGKIEDGQADLIGLDKIHVEVKRVERLNIYDAIEQAKRDSKNSDNLPAVFHRKNNCEWLVTMRLEDWIKLYRDYADIRH